MMKKLTTTIKTTAIEFYKENKQAKTFLTIVGAVIFLPVILIVFLAKLIGSYLVK